MPRRSGWSASSQYGTRWWVIAGLVALLVVDAALVWVALSSNRASASAAAPTTVELTPATPVAGATPEQEPTETPTAPAPAGASRVTVVLAAFDAQVAYRAATGACPTAQAVVEVTTDGGVTWSPAELEGASAPTAIAVSSPDEASVLAATAEGCEAVAYRTFVRGADWAPGESFAVAWRLEGAEVIAPGGARSAPCAEPAQVAAADASAATVLCGDASFARTIDGGATWASTDPIAGATAVAMQPGAAGTGARVLLAGLDGCAGVQVASVTADGSLAAPGACLTTDAAAGASTLAVDTAGGVWVWSGTTVARSADGGASW